MNSTAMRTPFRPVPQFRSRFGFTLVEILIVIALIGILGSVSLAAFSSIKRGANKARDVGAMKAMLVAYAGVAADNGGRLMPGYDADAVAYNEVGERLSHPVSTRYPFRLAAAMGYKMKGVFYFDGPRPDEYEVSLGPGIGMNSYLVGGYHEGGQGGFEDTVTKMAQVGDASNLLVFATATSHTVTAPTMPGANWTPEDTGEVDFRYQEKAVAGFFDGSIRVMEREELEDMRLWSDLAQRENNPGHVMIRKKDTGKTRR